MGSLTLCSRSRAQADAGAEVSIASLPFERPVYGPFTTDPVRIAALRGGRPLGFGNMRLHLIRPRDLRALRTREADVVHVHAEFNPDNWWAPLLRRPLVLSPHGAFHPTVLTRGERSKKLYTTVARRLLYGRVARFHALNPAEQADIAAAVPGARAYCVPQGASPAVAQAPAASEDGSAAAPRLMFIGRLDIRTKGLDILIEAFARSAAEATLTLVGPDHGDAAARLRSLAERFGVERLVDIRGSVGADEVPALLRGCDVYVQLSRNEGSPLSLNDALALGKPAIVSDRVGTVSCSEVARLRHVKVIPPSVPEAAQAISAVVDDLERLRRAAREAQAELREFLSWERAARLHLEQYSAL